jgi:hypothetical protein
LAGNYQGSLTAGDKIMQCLVDRFIVKLERLVFALARAPSV